ncbi:peptidase T [Tabrizicola sp. J26]|uniref:peptidase T n=1 Tax=Alitabrizicola rongguiensis TaxID=2909234 RepID=UPI001F1A3F51|nr:peptidase T [Tabrizicola rongguiensis]MCF1707586.1 peptidase T [Tabrizicola rongguiensis]
MRTEFDQELEERLIRYAKIDTQSDESSPTSPSTPRQHDLLRLLAEELRGIGAKDVRQAGYGTVIATIPATVKDKVPTIALLAHVDTAPGFAASGVKPRVVKSYNGGPIQFPDAPDLILSPEQFPYLATKAGDDIITASGTTLLGADDKAGVAILMATARHLLANPSIPHGEIRIAFTPDEEIGRGVHKDLPKDLAVDFAYTLDGGQLGEIVGETFSADGAVVKIEGVSIHPGEAKDKLVNALHLAAKIVDTLPKHRLTPETASGREGFIFLYSLTGTAATAELHFALRDFDRALLAEHDALLRKVCETVQAGEPRARITCEIFPQYRNMADWLDKDPRPVKLAEEACRRAGIEPFSQPIRGGTDGSRLTEMGVPTPNIFTGMQNLHGPLEWISVQDMGAATKVCLELVQLVAAK